MVSTASQYHTVMYDTNEVSISMYLDLLWVRQWYKSVCTLSYYHCRTHIDLLWVRQWQYDRVCTST